MIHAYLQPSCDGKKILICGHDEHGNDFKTPTDPTGIFGSVEMRDAIWDMVWIADSFKIKKKGMLIKMAWKENDFWLPIIVPKRPWKLPLVERVKNFLRGILQVKR